MAACVGAGLTFLASAYHRRGEHNRQDGARLSEAADNFRTAVQELSDDLDEQARLDEAKRSTRGLQSVLAPWRDQQAAENALPQIDLLLGKDEGSLVNPGPNPSILNDKAESISTEVSRLVRYVNSPLRDLKVVRTRDPRHARGTDPTIRVTERADD